MTGDVRWVITTDSIYRLDLGSSEVERVTGIAPPTPRQGPDGTAQPYAGLWVVDSMGQRQVDQPIPGIELQIQWGGTRGTQVSTVVAVTDRPAWGRSYWVTDPESTPTWSSAGIIAAGRLVAGRLVAGALSIEAALVTAALLTVGSAESAAATAVGLAAAAHLDLHQWSTVDGQPAFADVPADGWRRPWTVPPGFDAGPPNDLASS